MRCSIQPRYRIFIKGHEFLSLAKNMDKYIRKNTSKNVSSKYSQRLPDHIKQFATDALKTVSKREIKRTAESSSYLISNKIDVKITKVSRTSSPNSSDTVTNKAKNIEHDKEIPTERYISPEKRQKIIDDLRLM